MSLKVELSQVFLRYLHILYHEHKADVESVQKILQEALKLFTEKSAKKEIAINYHYTQFAALVLREGATHWNVFFGKQVYEQVYLELFNPRHISPAAVFHVLAKEISKTKTKGVDRQLSYEENLLQQAHDGLIARECLKILDRFFQDDGIQLVFADLDTTYRSVRDKPRTAEWINYETKLSGALQYIGSISSLIANRIDMEEIPRTFNWKTYAKIVIRAMFQYALSQATFVTASQDTHKTYFGECIQKFVALGYQKLIAKLWLRQLNELETDFAIHQKLFQDIPDQHIEKLLQSIVDRLCKVIKEEESLSSWVDIIKKWLSDVLRSNSHVQYVLCCQIIMKKALDRGCMEILVELLDCQNPVNDTSPLIKAVDRVQSLWTQDRFVGEVDFKLHASISYFLELSIPKMSKNILETRGLIPPLCRGVQNHMSHSILRIRHLGMKIGEVLSVIIDPDNPLKFSELNEEQSSSESSDEEKKLPQNRQRKKLVVKKHANETKKVIKQLDPDEVVDSSSEDEQQDQEKSVKETTDSVAQIEVEEILEEDSGYISSDSDISLAPYDLEDDEEDLRPHKTPMYLAECVEGLEAQDERDKTEASLFALENLVRERPYDLQDWAPRIAGAILRLEDKYSTKKFVEHRMRSMTALCCVVPVQVIQYYSHQALDRKQLYQSRLDVLHAMINAAYELSGRKRLDSDGPAFRPKLLDEEKSVNALESSTVARTANAIKTRRWGYRRDPAPEAKQNEFTKYAGLFFYPLLYGYGNPLNTEAIPESGMDVEGQFLSYLLHALGCFVECSANSPAVLPMANCLLDFASAAQGHPVAAVRRQVLFALSRVLLVTPDFSRREVLPKWTNVQRFLTQMQASDVDSGCRDGASVLLKSGGFFKAIE